MTVREYPLTDPKFPCIVVSEGDLSVEQSTFDSGGYHHNRYEVTLEIYTRGSTRISECDRIRNDVDYILTNNYGLRRVSSNPVPNMGDLNIYRYRLTYVGLLDKNKTIYRG